MAIPYDSSIRIYLCTTLDQRPLPSTATNTKAYKYYTTDKISQRYHSKAKMDLHHKVNKECQIRTSVIPGYTFLPWLFAFTEFC